MRQDCIKITMTLLIPFDGNKFGDTGRAELLANQLAKDIEAKEGVTVDRYQVKKCRVDAE